MIVGMTTESKAMGENGAMAVDVCMCEKWMRRGRGRREESGWLLFMCCTITVDVMVDGHEELAFLLRECWGKGVFLYACRGYDIA